MCVDQCQLLSCPIIGSIPICLYYTQDDIKSYVNAYEGNCREYNYCPTQNCTNNVPPGPAIQLFCHFERVNTWQNKYYKCLAEQIILLGRTNINLRMLILIEEQMLIWAPSPHSTPQTIKVISNIDLQVSLWKPTARKNL